MDKRQLSEDKETGIWRRYQRDMALNIIWETELYHNFAAAARDQTSNTVWETELYCDFISAKEILVGSWQWPKRLDNEYNPESWIVLSLH